MTSPFKACGGHGYHLNRMLTPSMNHLPNPSHTGLTPPCSQLSLISLLNPHINLLIFESSRLSKNHLLAPSSTACTSQPTGPLQNRIQLLPMKRPPPLVNTDHDTEDNIDEDDEGLPCDIFEEPCTSKPSYNPHVGRRRRP
ncbi:hypothetical protein DFH28DRAFT_951851 [Melampsora americana]|nr:hypothetical protein DFH28DRAFT_951851 [Melampsora americana]